MYYMNLQQIPGNGSEISGSQKTVDVFMGVGMLHTNLTFSFPWIVLVHLFIN